MSGSSAGRSRGWSAPATTARRVGGGAGSGPRTKRRATRPRCNGESTISGRCGQASPANRQRSGTSTGGWRTCRLGTGPFNLGDENDYRVPDRGYHRSLPSSVWVPTAAVVVEVISPDDETWAKFDFYVRHDVDEICTADPVARELRWFVRPGNAFQESPASELLNVSVADLSGQIVWPS